MRNFLKRNEVYFNTLSSLLLGIMAIVVSLNSNRIAKEQSRINYFENSPDFHFMKKETLDSLGYPIGISVQLNKSRGKAKNIKVKVECYAHFKLLDKNKAEKDKYIHLINFFHSSYYTGKSQGDIKLIEGYNTLINYEKFKQALYNELTNQNYTSVIIDNVLLAKVSYTNFLNETKDEYYDISNYEGVLLDKKDHRVKIYNSINMSPKSVSITDFNSNDIIRSADTTKNYDI